MMLTALCLIEKVLVNKKLFYLLKPGFSKELNRAGWLTKNMQIKQK